MATNLGGSSAIGSKKKPLPYSKVSSSSSHGNFSIEDDDDDDEENNDGTSTVPEPAAIRTSLSLNDFGHITTSVSNSDNQAEPCAFPRSAWNVLTFGWMKPLLQLGNERALEQTDLLPLLDADRADSIYTTFKGYWREQLAMYNVEFEDVNEKDPNSIPSSLVKTYAQAFGLQFFFAGGLKLIYDSCLFLGPLILNLLIKFLNDPDEPFAFGMWLVLAMFTTQFLMSVCLRQYFWRCYRVGMNLRAAVVTSVFSKSLVLATAALSKRSVGEITNLMAVDSTRLQDLTPYLHAVWYSLYQIMLALVLKPCGLCTNR